MTVKELIEQLAQYPQEARVVLAGYEGGYNHILKFSTIPLKVNAHTEWWYGVVTAGDNVAIGRPHEQVYPVNDGEGDKKDALRVLDFQHSAQRSLLVKATNPAAAFRSCA